MTTCNKFAKFLEPSDETRPIITAAVAKLLAQGVLATTLDDTQFTMAQQFVTQHSSEKPAIYQANLALVAVIKVALFPNITPSFLDHGNLLTAPLKPVTEVPTNKVVTLIQTGIWNPLVFNKLHTSDTSSTSKGILPTLNPITNPYNPFESYHTKEEE